MMLNALLNTRSIRWFPLAVILGGWGGGRRRQTVVGGKGGIRIFTVL